MATMYHVIHSKEPKPHNILIVYTLFHIFSFVYCKNKNAHLTEVKYIAIMQLEKKNQQYVIHCVFCTLLTLFKNEMPNYKHHCSFLVLRSATCV